MAQSILTPKWDLLIIKVFQRNRYLIFTLLIEDHFECTRVITYFEESAHWLLLLVDYATDDDNLTEKI